MPPFVKTPRFIVSAIVMLWLLYVVWANFNLEPIEIHLLPFGFFLTIKVMWALIGAMVFGIILSIIAQLLWRRRSSKNASSPLAA